MAARWQYLHLKRSTGYGTAGVRTMAALEGAGLAIDPVLLDAGDAWGRWLEPVDPGWSSRPAEVVVAHAMPEYYPYVRAARPDAFVVGHTAWETDRIPAHWRPGLQAVDLLVVPCPWNAEVIRGAGITTPVVVIPHPVAPPHPPVDLEWRALAVGVVTFYVIAEWTERKGVADTVRAFVRAFGADDDVQLLVKTTPLDRTRATHPQHPLDAGTTAYAVAEILREVADPPRVHLLVDEVADAEVAALHRLGDCYVSLCRGEGWGIGAFDAATLGTPVVTTGWSGHLDYLGGSSLLVRYELVPADHGPAPDVAADQQHWASPDLEHAVELLRAVARDPDLLADERAAIAADIRARCAADVVAARWVEAARRHGAPV